MTLNPGHTQAVRVTKTLSFGQSTYFPQLHVIVAQCCFNCVNVPFGQFKLLNCFRKCTLSYTAPPGSSSSSLRCVVVHGTVRNRTTFGTARTHYTPPAAVCGGAVVGMATCVTAQSGQEGLYLLS